MPRYHFQVINDVFEHRDEEGVVLQDLRAAEAFAEDMLRDIVKAERFEGIEDATVRILIQSNPSSVVSTVRTCAIRELQSA